MYRVLDVAFSKDHYRVRRDNAGKNFAILRRIVMDLPKRDRASKAALKIRDLKARANDRYIAQLLGWDHEWKCDL